MDQHQKCPSHRLENIHEEGPASCLPASVKPPETPTETMEFLARSWSLSAVELSKALSNKFLPSPSPVEISPSQPAVVVDMVMQTTNSKTTQSANGTPIGHHGKIDLQPLQAAQPFCGSPPISTREREDLKLHNKGRSKTVGGWLKDHMEKKREETRTRHAQIHAATSVAGVAAAVAAIAAATVLLPGATVVQSDNPSKTSAAVAAAATLVASHCIEMAQAMGSDRAQILTVINSAVNVRTTGDIMALTAGAATALRGAATLRARLHKGIHNVPVTAESKEPEGRPSALEFVSKGGELLKRTRKGVLHWKQVSIYINANWQVVVKMKSMHMAGTFVKKKKSVVTGIYPEIPAWIGRDMEDGSNQRAYFGIKTLERLIEFECRNKQDKQIWIEGIEKMLHCHSKMNINM